MLSVLMLSVIYAQCHMLASFAEFHYAECRYVECRYAECRGTPRAIRKKILKNILKNKHSFKIYEDEMSEN
jgi:hypothetical protein